MSRKNHSTGAKSVTCNKCLRECHGIPGHKHRNCAGAPDQPPRKSGNYLPGADRGRWE